MERKIFLTLILLLFFTSCFSQTRQEGVHFDAYDILAADEDAADTKWAEYLCLQLEHRGFLSPKELNNTLEIIVDMNPSMEEDYSFLRTKNRLTLKAKDQSSMLWILYQFISWVAQYDGRIDASDLPPALLDMNQSNQGTFMFDYRGIYSPTNCDPDFMAVNASHNVDYDWGLWGHNLKKVLHETEDESIYAWHDGKRDHQQFCFSSEHLYQRLLSFVIDNYGEGSENKAIPKTRFCIMPEDNSIVCLCDQCRQAGNSTSSATPAVTKMLGRMAARFPNHLFFTTAYLTTEMPSSEQLPENGGVIISAIDLPLSHECKDEMLREKFERQIEQWRTVTTRIYIWDYMRNFDDYLTPFPVLGILKERLDLFKRWGVSGIFYNGSGYDYASLDDLQTFVLASLLKRSDIDLSALIKSYLNKFYPQTGELIYKYYTTVEQRVAQRHAILEYYGGINAAVHAYLIPDEFKAFYEALDAQSKHVSGEERVRLNKLLTALNFTMLELMRTPEGLPYDAKKVEELLYNLEGHSAFPEMKNYREAHGEIDSYLASWNKYAVCSTNADLILQNFRTYLDGKLSSKIEMLSDSYYGFPSDYHTGWYQCKDSEISIEDTVEHDCTLVIVGGFMYAPKWKIDLPDSFVVYINDKQNQAIPFPSNPVPYSKQSIRLELKVSAGDQLRIVVKPSRKPLFSVACDEIEVYEKR